MAFDFALQDLVGETITRATSNGSGGFEPSSLTIETSTGLVFTVHTDTENYGHGETGSCIAWDVTTVSKKKVKRR